MTKLYSLLFLLLSLSLDAGQLPAFNVDFRNGGFNPFNDRSGNWQETPTGLQEYSDLPDQDSVTFTNRLFFGPNTALTVTVLPKDEIGTMWIDFGCKNNGDCLRLVHESGNSVAVSLYRVSNGKHTLLYSVDNTDVSLDRGNGGQMLQFKLSSSGDAIQVQLNKTQLFCVRCADMPSGGVALGVRGRKVEFKTVSARTYENLTLAMTPVEVPDLEFTVQHNALRHSFYRDEKTILKLNFINRMAHEVTVQEPCVVLPDGTDFVLSDRTVGPGEVQSWELPLDGAQWSGECRIVLKGKIQDKTLQTQYDLFFAERPGADAYIFATWNGETMPSFLDFLKDNGFNGSETGFAPYEDFEKQRKVIAALHDRAIRNGMLLKFSFPIIDLLSADQRKFAVVLPDGSSGRVLNCNLPEAQQYAQERGRTLGEFLRDYPAFRWVLLSSEVESVLSISCGPGDKERYERLFGQRLPELQMKSAEIDGMNGIVLQLPDDVKKNMPPVIPADNKWYSWLTFLWKKGFGDNLLHAQIAAEIKRVNPQLETEHDPFRDFPVFDRNIGLDYYGTWFYPTPDAGESFMAIETMLAAIAGGGNKQKMQYGASLWLYADIFCPARDRQAGVQPENIYLETLFLGLAARPDKIELFSLTFLQPDVRLEYRQNTLLPRMKNFSQNVAEPLWPAMRPLLREECQVSLLLSSASQIFGSQNWGGFGYTSENSLLDLLWKAHLPTNVIFEDTIRKDDSWQKSRLLVLGTVTHLPDDVFAAILRYARNGGKVLACAPFAKLIPGAEPLDINFDFAVKSAYHSIRGGSPYVAEKAQECRLHHAEALRSKYRTLITPFADSDSVELYLRTLKDEHFRYVFAVNDRRTLGDYMGRKFRAVLDQGLELSAPIVLDMPSGAIYEFPAGKKLQALPENGKLRLNLTFAPAEGKILLCYKEEIGQIAVEPPRPEAPGKVTTGRIILRDISGKPFLGTVPVRVQWTDPAGRTRTEYTAIRNGEAQLSLRPARNDAKGTWHIQATELASGKSIEAEF